MVTAEVGLLRNLCAQLFSSAFMHLLFVHTPCPRCHDEEQPHILRPHRIEAIADPAPAFSCRGLELSWPVTGVTVDEQAAFFLMPVMFLTVLEEKSLA